MSIQEYIQLNYNKIKHILQAEYRKLYIDKQFDEDIFHDTLLKVIYAKSDEDIDESIINYFITAFKMNVIRQTLYAYIKDRTEMEDMNSYEWFIEDFYSSIDTEKTVSLIKKNFGKKYTICFILWCKGWTIKEIENHYEIYNLYYKFNLIKKYIEENCL